MTIRITDHAVLRWLERVHGLDIEGMRAQLLADIGPLATMGATLGPRFVVKRDDGKYLFQGRTLVTVVGPDQMIYRRWELAAVPTNEVAP
jgi:hypothetical protein